MSDLSERLPMWVIYRPTTKDFAGSWVARLHLTLPEPVPTDQVFVGETLAELRDQLPLGLTCIGRDGQDDPVIEEVWL